MSDLSGFLLTTGRTLSQMALYSPEHPTVKGAVGESHRLLTDILSQEQELVISISEKKLIINGQKPEGIPETALRPFLQLLETHHLHSLTFLPGLTLEEMNPFFRLAGGDIRKSETDAATFLQNNNVTHVKLNIARYAKIGEEDEVGKKGDTGQTGKGAGTGIQDFENLSLNDLIKKLIDKSIPNPEDRTQVFARALSLVKKQIDEAVEKVTIEFNKEKTRLTNERERTEQVVNEFADGVVVVDENGHVLMMNPAAEQIYGVKLGESLGKPIWEGVSSEQMIALAKDLHIPTDRPVVKEVEIRGSQEAQRTLRASAATVQDTNGRVVGMVSVLSDVTKQKELNRMQNEFMANVTHDLRAPIHAVKLSVGAILEGSAGAVTPEQEKMLGMANKNVERLSRLIDDLLDFSKIESGKMEVRPQVIEIHPLLREAVGSMESWSKSRNIALALEEGAGMPPVYADGDRVLQVVNNLISNAIKFTPVGGKITLRTRRVTENEKGMVAIDVEDTGAGISDADQKRIFQRFVQLHNQPKAEVRGTGLGLNICRALVELHKGSLTLKSPPPNAKNGSLFTFTLPSVQRSAVSASTKPAVSAQMPATPKKKIGFWRKILRMKVIFLALGLFAGIAEARPHWGTVRRVLDPETFQLRDGTRVRLLGIDGPQKGSPHYTEAVSASRAWIENKEVRFEYGLQERDAQGTWVAYVFVDGIHVNEELVRQGLALVARLPNEESRLRDLVSAEREAHTKKRGQWRDTVIDPYPVRAQRAAESNSR